MEYQRCTRGRRRDSGELRQSWLTVIAIAVGVGCSSGGTDGIADPSAVEAVPGRADPGQPITSDEPEALAELNSDLSVARNMNGDEVVAAHSVRFNADLGYEALEAAHLEEILTRLYRGSDEQAQTALRDHGFVIDGSLGYSSFVDGYGTIYMTDMPVFISADMVLEALYRSHDKILQGLERELLRPRLGQFLNSLRVALVNAQASFSPEAASDLNFYLGVALSLLNGEVDGREPDGVAAFYDAAVRAKGIEERVLFGVERRIDFSQFKPRGHYAGDESLERYFRAMMWLGRTEFRLIETLGDGKRVLRRREVESMVALRQLVDEAIYADYRTIDDTLTAFVGEHDYMSLQQVNEFLSTLNGSDGLEAVTDEEIAAALLDGQYGSQRIASQVMSRYPGDKPLPLSVSFALLGQRYTVDSHVFSNLVYDRLPTRVVPNPLDVAFAALGNDQALSFLGDELFAERGYAGELAAMRTLVDAHPEETWQSSLYTTWLGSLRTLSPKTEVDVGLPGVARTEAWGRRLLNTQLGSWAQLRHNNVLYVKQSYTSNALCEYPDAYVDPYPEFFEAMVGFAERATTLFDSLNVEGEFADSARAYFTRVASINTRLARMAKAQRSGDRHEKDDLEFINQAVSSLTGCDGTVLGHSGWYSELHFDPLDAVKVDPVITDVHTDIGGDLPVPRDPSVLHVGTGLPRLMVVTVDSCEGPRAYAGVVFDYREFKEPQLTRLTDEEWRDRLYEGDVPGVPWLEPIMAE